MEIYVDKVEKRNVHPVSTFHRAPHRSGEKDTLNRRGMSNYNKTFLQCSGVYSHKVKCPAESIIPSIAKQN